MTQRYNKRLQRTGSPDRWGTNRFFRHVGATSWLALLWHKENDGLSLVLYLLF